MTPIKRDGKIVFANQLRGLAVLSVIVAHYLGVYWFGRDVVAQTIGAPIVEGGAPRIFPYVFFAPTFNYGPFGVAVFFLISGFVIPFSLEKLGGVKFITARLFRIFPTYWAATLVTLGAIYLSTRYWGSQFYVTSEQATWNLLLLHQQLNVASIDMVNWTLCIEVLFYVAALLMWPFIKRASALALVNFSLVVMALVTWWPASWDTIQVGSTPVVLAFFKYQLMMVSFLFIGTLFNFRLNQRISTATLFASTIGIFIAFLAAWPHTSLAAQFWATPINYFYALVLFSCCFALRDRFRPLKIVDFFANISYPLYLVHAVSGYAIIRLLMVYHFRYYQAAAVALICAVAVAYILHRVIEMPTANIWNRRKPMPDQQTRVESA
ncbi:acyltransferase family protein [Burkholderia ambifaria]|jgi:peptidoglycan/LPS O-acetylase OafA/YrhL|uniref:acyltransferase family protein n=1 Tax=Burkholderia ambifaria TaxID=152480 RepID=UPI0024460CAF|nr:acyltransferase [Burkholderia ambifaria]